MSGWTMQGEAYDRELQRLCAEAAAAAVVAVLLRGWMLATSVCVCLLTDCLLSVSVE